MSDDGKLDDCHCCDVPAAGKIDNRPGLPALAYRAGTWATFFTDMQVAIASQPDLAKLTTRAPDDPTIALLDAWSVVGDILTFYQERLANEGYLRTATDRRSVQELAREIGYELGAGVAASTVVAFTIDQPLVPNASLPVPSEITIPATTRIQSVPGANQLPQTFETIEDIEARAAWNTMVPKTGQRQRISVIGNYVFRVSPSGGYSIAETLYFAGTGTNLRVGDAIVISVGAANFAHNDSVTPWTGTTCMWVTKVRHDYSAKVTAVDLSQDGTPDQPFSLVAQPQGVVELTPLAMTPSNVRKKILDQDWTEENLSAFLEVQDWDPTWVVEHVAMLLAKDPPPVAIQAFRTKTGVFGHNAPDWQALYNAIHPKDMKWSDWDTPATTVWQGSDDSPYTDNHHAHLFLDRVVQGVAKRGYVALMRSKKTSSANPAPPTPLLVDHVAETSIADFSISAKATGVFLKNVDGSAFAPATGDWSKFKMRTTTVFCQSEELDVADAPIPEPFLAGSQLVVTLDRMVLGLYQGQKVSWTGLTLDPDTGNPSGSHATEVLVVASATHSRGLTTITFQGGLEHSYVRSSVVMNGNVAASTHGATTTNELIGSGDGSKVHQTFVLRTAPLTYVSAETPSGAQSTLVVRVAGVQWTEVRSFYAYGPHDRVFISRQQADGTTAITFGDGIRGARLPTGRNNVYATYRTGTGPDGQVKAGKIAVLQSKPLGVKAAVNAIAATGAAAIEQLADARTNAPRTVRTLDRLVSLDDFADFARSFAGVGKAQATPVWSGEQLRVHLSLGDAIGKPLDPTATVGTHLVTAIGLASDGRHEVLIAGYQPRFFRLDLNAVIDPAYVTKTVVRDIKATLKAAFSYPKRDLGQSVTEAEIIALVQARPGVIATEIKALYDADKPPTMTGVLQAFGAHFSGTTVVPADLLLIHPVGLTVTGSAPP